MSDELQYITGADAMQRYAESDALDSLDSTRAMFTPRTFNSIDTNISVQSEYLREDYDYFRKNEAVPSDKDTRTRLCVAMYKDNGIVHNVIDLMSDFASQGIHLQHENPAINMFYQTFAKKVGLKDRSERFVNYLLKGGSVVIKKSTAKIGAKYERKWKKSTAEDLEIEETIIDRKEIPIRYTYFLPPAIEVVGKEIAQFVGKPIYAIRLPVTLKSSMTSLGQMNNDLITQLQNQIPEDIRQEVLTNKPYIVPDQSKMVAYHYKKDDDEVWGTPLVSPILKDLIQLDKYKLADISAMDGARSNIRLWNLGIIGEGPNTSILPTKAAFNRLRGILSNNVSGGTLDLVWGPELSFKETASQAWRFLTSEKYEPVWNAIYEGLGIPPSMRTSGKGSSGTGNYVGLNTLIKRLQYVRDILISFWTEELAYIHEAMEFPGKPPAIIFDFMVFTDEAAQTQLWIELLDRGVISIETMQELMGRYPGFEKSRVVREYKAMENGKYPDKASPFHNPDKDHELKKILLQGGSVTPSEVGVELDEKKSGEVPAMEKEAKLMPKPAPFSSTTKKKKQGSPGRPKNVTETKKRKPKPKGRPSVKANIYTWSLGSYNKISDILNPVLLNSVAKSNMRKLTTEEANSFEYIKFGVLCRVEAFSTISEDLIKEIMRNGIDVPIEIYDVYTSALAEFKSINDREPNIDEIRMLYATAYATYLSSDEDGV